MKTAFSVRKSIINFSEHHLTPTTTFEDFLETSFFHCWQKRRKKMNGSSGRGGQEVSDRLTGLCL
jgi:hypothetical protein